MVHGIINVYKEKGFTSFDVVAKLRGIVGQKKIGHTGTLDPDATGVLPVCFGKATKLCDMLTDKNKTYEAVMLLGKSTDTQDISGTVLEEKDTSSLTEKQIRDCILGYIGDYEQIPPMYSALKVNGKKLYELAREGKEVERKARHVQILDIQILDMDLPRVHMEVSCSKGTYIRTLCHDIGQDLGVCACMEELKRTRVSSFLIENSETLSQIEKRRDEGTLDDIIIPIDAMFADYSAVHLNERGRFLVSNGNRFTQMDIEDDWDDMNRTMNTTHENISNYVRVYDDENHFMAIYEWKENEKFFQIVKMFFDREE